MQMPVKKWFTFIEETAAPAGEAPQRKVAIVAVVANPCAGRQVEDLQPMIDASVDGSSATAFVSGSGRTMADASNTTWLDRPFTSRNTVRRISWRATRLAIARCSTSICSGPSMRNTVGVGAAAARPSCSRIHHGRCSAESGSAALGTAGASGGNPAALVSKAHDARPATVGC